MFDKRCADMSRYFLSKPAKSSEVYFTWPIDMFIWCLTDWHDNDLPGETNEGWQLVGQSPWQKLQTKAASTSCRSPPCHCFKCHGGDHSKQSNLILHYPMIILWFYCRNPMDFNVQAHCSSQRALFLFRGWAPDFERMVLIFWCVNII